LESRLESHRLACRILAVIVVRSSLFALLRLPSPAVAALRCSCVAAVSAARRRRHRRPPLIASSSPSLFYARHRRRHRRRRRRWFAVLVAVATLVPLVAAVVVTPHPPCAFSRSSAGHTHPLRTCSCHSSHHFNFHLVVALGRRLVASPFLSPPRRSSFAPPSLHSAVTLAQLHSAVSFLFTLIFTSTVFYLSSSVVLSFLFHRRSSTAPLRRRLVARLPLLPLDFAPLDFGPCLQEHRSRSPLPLLQASSSSPLVLLSVAVAVTAVAVIVAVMVAAVSLVVVAGRRRVTAATAVASPHRLFSAPPLRSSSRARVIFPQNP
jgi:hypothetical protein